MHLSLGVCGGGGGGGDLVLEVCDEHAELGAPVADVVDPGHVMSGKLEHPGDALADDGGPEVADMPGGRE